MSLMQIFHKNFSYSFSNFGPVAVYLLCEGFFFLTLPLPAEDHSTAWDLFFGKIVVYASLSLLPLLI